MFFSGRWAVVVLEVKPKAQLLIAAQTRLKGAERVVAAVEGHEMARNFQQHFGQVLQSMRYQEEKGDTSQHWF
jgi:hypothetical protein